MLAWKFFAAGAVAPFTGVPWPLPSESAHAEWVEGAPGDGKGVHACSVEDLPYWFDQELWRVELGGPVTRSGRQLVARRGRLVGRVATWPEAQDEFTRGCIERTRRRVAPFTGVPWPLPSESAHAGWVEGAPGDGKGVLERTTQVEWLAKHLALTRDD